MVNNRTLGRTGWQVSEIGYGAWGIGGAMWQGSDDTQSLAALHAALDAGCTFIDTALAYGDGHSESLVGRAVREQKGQAFVATKVPPKNGLWPARGGIGIGHDPPLAFAIIAFAPGLEDSR